MSHISAEDRIVPVMVLKSTTDQLPCIQVMAAFRAVMQTTHVIECRLNTQSPNCQTRVLDRSELPLHMHGPVRMCQTFISSRCFSNAKHR